MSCHNTNKLEQKNKCKLIFWFATLYLLITIQKISYLHISEDLINFFSCVDFKLSIITIFVLLEDKTKL